jgi:hypothetical protein
VVVVPKNSSAGENGPPALVLASIRTFTLKLLTAAPMRQSAWTEPLMLEPVSACVVASSATAPVPLNVSVTRVNTVPKFTMLVWPV